MNTLQVELDIACTKVTILVGQLKIASEDLTQERTSVGQAKQDLHEERGKCEQEKKKAQIAGVDSVFFMIQKQHSNFNFSFLGPSVEKMLTEFKEHASKEDGDKDIIDLSEENQSLGEGGDQPELCSHEQDAYIVSELLLLEEQLAVMRTLLLLVVEDGVLDCKVVD